jgi:microcystin degradation protein MlrC
MAATRVSRVAVLGMLHQTNVLAGETARRDWTEGTLRGAELGAAASRSDARLPIELGAFLESAGGQGLEPVPLVAAAAEAGGPLRQEVYEDFLRDAVQLLQQALPVDALLLALNGAMVTAKEDDPEGKLAARLRETIGPEVPMLVMLEPCANPSDLLMQSADLVLATPDPTERGHVAIPMLKRLLAGERYQTVLLRLPLLVPLATLSPEEGAFGTLAREAELAGKHDPLIHAAVLHGFIFSDRARSGVSVLVTARSKPAATAMAKHLGALVWSERKKLQPHAQRLDQAALFAAEICSHPGESPLVLADIADDPQGGGSANTTFLLEALLQQHVTRTLLGPFIDPKLAEEAHYRKVGAPFIATFNRGGNIGYVRRLQLDATVTGLSQGKGTGMWGRWAGRPLDFGLAAALDLGGVTVAVASRRQPVADAALFGLLGIDIGSARVLAVKGSGLVRGGFSGLVPGAHMVEVDGPGLTSADLDRHRFRNLLSSKYPLDQNVSWSG